MNSLLEFVLPNMKKQPQFKLLKKGQTTPVFVGAEEVTRRCLETLERSFFFVAGNAKPVTDEFPFSVEPH